MGTPSPGPEGSGRWIDGPLGQFDGPQKTGAPKGMSRGHIDRVLDSTTDNQEEGGLMSDRLRN